MLLNNILKQVANIYLDLCWFVVFTAFILQHSLITISKEPLDSKFPFQTTKNLVDGSVFDGVLMNGKCWPAECRQ